GLGRGSTTWPVDTIADEIDWSEHFDVPVGLVTGTNGKTTTVRLTQHILRAAELNVGLSSTDWIGVNDEIIDRGDYSGPGGARTVLRQKQVDVAVLETARGGLLRRGLGVPRADAALITNIAEDHLGDFGSQNLQELLDLKWIVMKALDKNSIAILNADDPLLTAKAAELDIPICWFSLDPAHPLLQHHRKNAGSATTVIDDQVARFDGAAWHPLCAVNDIPVTLDGSARHNIANALAAVALSHALGADDPAIARGLQSMQADDNPGRCNFFRVRGCDVLLDFAHNPSAMQAIFDIARTHPARRRLLCFGQAGDRTDELILELAANAWAIGLEHVMISELAGYRRGREAGEVFKLLRTGLIQAGAHSEQISHHTLERESLDHALNIARPGDLVIMLALADSKGILEYLKSIDGT
ncbi:MAG: Mur ligase, partial [Gammaproteobacteria bacterium]|nr:Mur ligase [Gammaproteobacteria bacterium]